MSDMVENGFSAGAKALPPKDAHLEFLALCALATSGSLSADEQKRLREHLSQCADCREAIAQYEAVVGKAIPALGPEVAPEDANSARWSLEQSEASLFARLEVEDAGQAEPAAQESQKLHRAGPPEKPQSAAGEALWRHIWWQYAAGLLLMFALGFAIYRAGIRQGTDSARIVVPVAPSRPSAIVPRSGDLATATRPPDGTATQSATQLARLHAQMDQQSLKFTQELTRAKADEAKMQSDLDARTTDVARLSQERDALAQQLAAAQANLLDVQHELNTRTNQSTENAAELVSLEAKVSDLTAALHERDQAVAQEKELLDHDRDIRELMGARDLYIAEVYDVAKTGDTQKPFGRVFYTQGKSLVFYAYDLDQQPGIKSADTFQVWGRRGPDREHAVNLGILYQDNASKKRWVLKSHDPRTLAQIDAVFVTVEPHGGSSHPSGKALLFAYLRISPNHP